MGIDYIPCDNCGDTFPDCGHYWFCADYAHNLCSDCEEELGLSIQCDDDDNRLDKCPYCLKQMATNHELFAFALCRLGMTREELLKEYTAS